MMKIQFVSLIILTAATSAGAQTWTYSDCVDYARAHNISLQKSRNRAAAPVTKGAAIEVPVLDV